jgi:SPP1 family holin
MERMSQMAKQNQPVQTKAVVVEVPEQAPKVSVKLVVATIVYIIAIVNAVAVFLGFDLNITPDVDKIYEGVSLAFALGAFGIGVFKNHNYTKAARIKKEVAKQIDTKK